MTLRRRALLTAAGVTIAVLSFAALQNYTGPRGGPIAPAKVLWLNLAIIAFIVLPLIASQAKSIDSKQRIVFGILGASFLVRGAIELPILYFTDAWHCSYGAAHDVLTAAAVVGVRLKDARRHTSDGLLAVGVALCLVEAAFATAFCSVADPAGGWFAHDSPEFRNIIRATWAVVVVAYPTLVVTAWRAFGQDPSATTPNATNPNEFAL